MPDYKFKVGDKVIVKLKNHELHNPWPGTNERMFKYNNKALTIYGKTRSGDTFAYY